MILEYYKPWIGQENAPGTLHLGTYRTYDSVNDSEQIIGLYFSIGTKNRRFRICWYRFPWAR